MRKPWTRIACVLLLVAPTVAEARADKVDRYVESEMKAQHIPALSLAVVKDGKTVKLKGYGWANLETGTRATPETVYKIGSLSKQFLASAILLLAGEGKVGLDDPVSKYLDGTPPAWSRMTIHQLLTHTAGLPPEAPGFDPTRTQSNLEIIKSLYAVPLLSAPGDKWSYSNAGYFIVAEIIEKASDKSWSDFCAERLFAPAGMIATRTTTADLVPHRATGYHWSDGRWRNADNWIGLRPSGAFLSTAADMARWDRELSLGRLLTPAMKEQMWTPVKLADGASYPYGFGWYLDPWQGHRRAHHEGGLPGFRAEIERFLDDHLTVIVLVDEDDPADPVRISLHVAGLYVPALLPAATAN